MGGMGPESGDGGEEDGPTEIEGDEREVCMTEVGVYQRIGEIGRSPGSYHSLTHGVCSEFRNSNRISRYVGLDGVGETSVGLRKTESE